MNEIAQDASSVGNALKTISMRIRAMDEETGEFDDTLQTISGDIYELTHGQVSIMQDANTYKDIYTILDDISKVWDSLTDKEHATLTETLFGKHRANIGSAIISNFEQARKAIETMENADGGAMAEMEVIMDSISYKTNTFKETLVGIAQNSFSQDFMKSMVDSGTRILNVFDDLSPSISFILEQFATLLEFVTKLADTIGGIPILIAGIGLKSIGNIKTWLYELKEVQMAINGISALSTSFNGGTNMFADTAVVTQYANQLRGLSTQQVELALSTKLLTAEQKQQIMAELGLIASENKIQSELLQTTLAQAGLSAEKQKAVLDGLNLINVTTGEVVANKACTKSELEKRLALEGVTVAQTEQIMSTLGMSTANATATVSFGLLTKSIWANIKAIGVWLISNPVGWAILATTAIAGVITIVDKLNVSLEEQQEISKKLEEEYDDFSSKLSDVEQQLNDTKQRIDELNRQDNLTFVEQEELDKLQITNEKLERQNELLKENQAYKGKEARDSIQAEYEKDFHNGAYGSLNNRQGYIDRDLREYADLIEIESRIYSGKQISDETADYYNENKDKIATYRERLIQDVSDIYSYIDRLRDNGATEDDSFLQQLLSEAERIDRILNPAEYKTLDFNKIIESDEFIADVQQIQKAVEDNKLSIENLVEQYPELTNAFKESGISAEEAVSQFYALNDELKNNSDNFENQTKSLEELQEAYDNLAKSASDYTKNQKSITSALEEQEKYGQISASTIQDLTDAGYARALSIDAETGAVTLNKSAVERLNEQKREQLKLDLAEERTELSQKFKDEQKAINDLAEEMKSANNERREAIRLEMIQHGQTMSDYAELMAQIDGSISSLDAPEFDNSKSSTKDEEPKSVTQFKKALAEKEHLLNTNQISEQEYYEWLDSESKRVYGNLADYEEDLWKYEEQVYKWRQEQEQDLFDKKIENYKKLSDDALDDKITDFGVSNEDVKNLEEFNKEMQKTWGLGNVDLTKRPKVAMDDGSTATVLSSTEFVWQGDDENGQYVAIHYTPILPDGTVLDDKSLEDYLYNTLEGSEDILKADNLGIVLKVDSDLSASEQEIKDFLNGNGISDNVQKILDDIEKWDNGLHEVQEQWVELDNKVKSSDSATTYANKWDYARSQINSAITETQNRINELSLKKGFEDEIDELTSDLEGLYDTLDDINKQEIESQKEYIETLKDEYSALMDEQIDQQKKLSDEIEKSYENRISAIDKQIDAIKKVSEAEERQKSILEAEKDVKEAMLELDKAKTKKRLVYSGDGSWHLKEDKSAVDEAKKNLEDKQESLNEAKQDEQIAKLEEQKELLETQKDNSKEYYDKVVTDLEEQKTAREKQYDILVDIYEQLGGDKKQTSLNESLVEKLTSNGDINKAVQGLTPTEMKQAITSGILTADSNGNYAIDYSILNKNEEAVKDNTAELEKLNNQLSGKSDTVDKNTPTYNNKNLDAEGYLIGTDGKRVLNDGKPIHAKNFSDEIAKHNTSKKMTDVVKGISKFAGYDTMQDLINAMITGEYTIPKSQLSNFMGTTISPKISQNMPRMGEYMTNAVNNTAPPINFTVNVDGSADEKTIQAMETKIGNMLISYTDKLTSSIATSSLRRQNKS